MYITFPQYENVSILFISKTIRVNKYVPNHKFYPHSTYWHESDRQFTTGHLRRTGHLLPPKNGTETPGMPAQTDRSPGMRKRKEAGP